MHPPSRHPAAARTDLEDFLETMRPKLDSMLASHSVPPEDADDLVHDAIVALLEQGMDRVDNSEAWLLGTLRYKILLHWRWRARQRHLLQLLSRVLAASEPPPQLHQDAVHDLLALTAHLPPRAVMVLWLRIGLGRKPREVARILRCRPDSVRKLTRRALERAQRNLASAGHLHALGRAAPAASREHPARPLPRAAPGPATGPAAARPIALAATVRRVRHPRGDLRRTRVARRSAPGMTSGPETRYTP